MSSLLVTGNNVLSGSVTHNFNFDFSLHSAYIFTYKQLSVFF